MRNFNIKLISDSLKVILLLLLIFVIIPACSEIKNGHLKEPETFSIEHQPPVWVTQKTHPEYPDASYITGVGSSGKGSNEADDAARLDLLKQIEVEITGEESSVQAELIKSGPKSGESQGSSYVQSRVDSKVHISVPGLSIKERWSGIAHNRFYSLAVINREEAAENIYRKIEELNIEIEKLIHAGEEAETHRDYNNAINYYKDAAERIKSKRLINPTLRESC